MAAASFLLVDAGNSLVKWATAARIGPIRPVGDLATARVTHAFLQRLARRFPRHEVVLACVVPRLLPLFRRAFGARLHLLTGADSRLGLAFAYPKPAELGADRLAAALAVRHGGGKKPFRGPAIIVSCGTAVAVTVLDAQGRLAGGVIAPGLQAQLRALAGAAAQLREVPLRRPRRALARSTGEAINAGVVLAYRGGVREIVDRLKQELPGGRHARIALTGGDARRVRDLFGPKASVEPLLVFRGLRIMGLRLLSSP